jgi:lipooligosaccharide transport system permease protein
MSGVLRVVETHARVYRRTWKGSAVTTFLSPVLFLGALGLGLGTLVDRGAGAELPAASYLAFLAPALLAANAMQLGASDSAFPVMAGIKWQKTYQAALATPVSARDLVLGHFSWVGLRLLVASSVFAAVIVLFGAVGPVGAAFAVLPAVLTGLAFASPVTAYAATVQGDYSLVGIFRFGVVPMFLFSGTFFPVSQLPLLLQPLAYVTPLWHGVQLTRATAGVDPTALPAALHVAYLAVWFCVGVPLAVRAMTRRLTP